MNSAGLPRFANASWRKIFTPARSLSSEIAAARPSNHLYFKVGARHGFRLNITDLNGPIKAGNGIISGGRRVFVGDVAGEIEISDGLGDKAIIQLLRLVDLVTSGITSGMKMADPLEVVANVANDVSVHDLRVVDVVENLHPWRVDARHDIEAPGDVIEHVVLVIHLAVQILNAQRHALVLGLRLDPVQERDTVVGALPIVHPVAVA